MTDDATGAGDGPPPDDSDELAAEDVIEIVDEEGSEAAVETSPVPEPQPAPVVPPPRRLRGRLLALLALLAATIACATILIGPWRSRPAAPIAEAPAPPPGPLFPILRPTVPVPTTDGDQRLAGVIVDGLGQPVGGLAITATVERLAAARDAAPDAGVARSAVAISDGDGRFLLGGLDAGRYRLEVSGAGVFTAEVRFVPVPTDELRLVLARRVAIVGTVVDGGAGAAGVVVAIDGDALGEVRTTVSADDGSFGFAELPEGTYRVWGGKGDLAARAQAAPRLGRGPFADVELILEPATIVVGKVVDRQTGAGLAAAVMLTPQDADDPDDTASDEAPRFARTDAGGVFRLEGVPHGRWTADAWAPGWITAGSVDFAAGRAMPTIELTPGGVIEGTVVDGAGRPVSGVVVAALERGGGREVSGAADDERLRRFSGRSARTPAMAATLAAAGAIVTGDDANFLPRGELGVMLGPIPYPRAAGAGVVRAAAIVDAVDDPAPAGSGSAPATLLGVSPAAIAPIAADPAYQPTWSTGADGSFRLVGVGAGTWIAYALAPGHPPARSKRLVLRLGQTLTGVELRLVDGVDVVGRVTNQRGEPVAGALLAFTPADDADPDAGPGAPGALQAVTDSAGRYRAGPLAGPTTIRVSAFGHADAAVKLELRADDRADRVQDIVLAVADAELTGIVEDPSGLPVVGARVEVSGGPAAGRAAVVGAGGHWTIAMLPPEPLTVQVEHAGYPRQRFPATPGTEARVQLSYGGGVEALVFDHHTGDALEGIAVSATGPGGDQRDLVTDAGGNLALVPVPAGSWTLRIKIPGYLARSLTIAVPAGDRPGQATVRDVRLELERGALIAGTVRDRRGDRVAGARVALARGDDEVTTTTDALGEFRLRDAPTGTVILKATKAGATARVELELRAGDERLAVDVELK